MSPPSASETQGKGKDASSSSARPQHLEGEVIPALLHKVGDVKVQRLAVWMVEAYLERHVLVFDKELLRRMFAEADYKEEGSLNPRALSAAISGRYPKRTIGAGEWRQLVMLLLGQQELMLSADVVQAKTTVKGASYNAEPSWSDTPPPLPPVSSHRVISSPAKPDFSRPLAPGPWGGNAARPFTMTGSGSAPLIASLRTGNQLNTVMAPRPADDATPGGALVLTTAGFRTTAQTPVEVKLNASMLGGTGASPRCTFDDARAFATFTQELDVECTQGLSASAAARLAASAATHGDLTWTLAPRGGNTCGATTLRSCSTGRGLGSSLGSGGSRAGSSTGALGSTAAASSLHTLRLTVGSTRRMQPSFELAHRSLKPEDTTAKACLGLELDSGVSLARTHPVRGTEVKFGASFTDVGDYNTLAHTT
ncbi:hypothetical protein FOA52_004928 [Chlamydomonas sp. UWO 241]|nr:hypothetical protein FOA52_004928 [Chlamydomonas sp. UWO 241]